MSERQVFTKANLSALLRLMADAIDRGEELEFEEGELLRIDIEKDAKSPYLLIIGSGREWIDSITLKPKPQLRKATAMEWLEWACDYDECKGWVVKLIYNEAEPPQLHNYLIMDEYDLSELKRAKFENGVLGEFDYFWVEV